MALTAHHSRYSNPATHSFLILSTSMLGYTPGCLSLGVMGTMSNEYKNARTIKIFLRDGNPNGTRWAELTMSTTCAMAFRRSQLSDAKATFGENIQRSGVYILLDADDSPLDQRQAYIGESGLFVVEQGSLARVDEVPAVPESAKKIRERMLRENDLRPEGESLFSLPITASNRCHRPLPLSAVQAGTVETLGSLTMIARMVSGRPPRVIRSTATQTISRRKELSGVCSRRLLWPVSMATDAA